MSHRRSGMTPIPVELHELHKQWGGPMLVLDYWMTRRQRLHSLYRPGEPHPWTDLGLFQVLDMGDIQPGERVLLTTIDASGTIRACYADFHPFNPEDLDNGQD